MFSSSHENPKRLTRRSVLTNGALITGGICAGAVASRAVQIFRQPEARVSIRKASSYRQPLASIIRETLLNYPGVVQRARSGTVVLKPNLVEYHDSYRINTHPAVVAGAIAAFKSVGAKQVVVAEGPGHYRDTELLLEQSDLAHAIESESSSFVDLNLDSVHPVELPTNYTRLGRIFFPETLLNASLIVSIPKLKTHHWVGMTLSMKNMFGTVPGSCYGWPKNILHCRGINESIVDINAALRPGFAIIDGIEAMEGDGPLRGETVNAGVLVMGDNLAAVDATAARAAGIYPERIAYLQMMLAHGGTLKELRIDQLGERISDVKRNFRVNAALQLLKEPLPLIRRVV